MKRAQMKENSIAANVAKAKAEGAEAVVVSAAIEAELVAMPVEDRGNRAMWSAGQFTTHATVTSME